MKLSEIKGERSLDIIADVMELADLLGDDDRVKGFMEELKGADRDDAWRLFCKRLPPVLRDQRYRRPVISLLATIAEVPYDEYAENGEVVKDIFELVTSDSDALAFFASSAATQG